ncbi:hypothetical protein Tco_0510515 [Tanacetum coccineum]
MSDIKGISPSYYTYKILMEDDFRPVIQPQRRLNPKVQDVVKNEIVKLLDSGLIYSISDSSWVSPIHVVPKKGGMTVVLNDNNELIPSRMVTGWRVCIDYRKLNDATRKDHFPLPFIDQMLERLCGNEYYCFLDGFSGFFQIPIAPEDQKDKFNLLYGSIHGRLLGHKISRDGIEVDRAEIDVIAKFPYPTNVKGVRNAKFDFSDDCKKAFNILKEKLTTALIIISPDWNVPFELMCVSDFAVEAVLGQRICEYAQRHRFFRYEGLEYSDADITDFEARLARIYRREVHRVTVFDFGGLPALMAEGLSARMLMEHRDDQGVSLFTSKAWRRLFDIRGPLIHELILKFYSTFRFGQAILDLDTPETLQFQLGRARRRMS